MENNWKTVLYKYVEIINQIRIDYFLAPLQQFVDDFYFIRQYSERMDRIKQNELARQTKPLLGNSRLTIVHSYYEQNKIFVNVKIVQEVTLRSINETYRETNTEYQQVKLEQNQGEWIVKQVIPLIPERSNFTDHHVISNTSYDGNFSTHYSDPFINKHLLPKVQPLRNKIYNRKAAQSYAHQYWNLPNPDYLYFNVDCTNFVSQCLFAGGGTMHYTGRRETGWWYEGMLNQQERWSFSWSVAHSLYYYLIANETGIHATRVNSPQQLTIGDVILYDFSGDGRIQHSVIVTGVTSDGMPLVNAHTSNSQLRYWDYRDSYAWTTSIKYYFLHINESVS